MHTFTHHFTNTTCSVWESILFQIRTFEMASSSNPRKRTKLAVVKNAGSDEPNECDYVERWFYGNQESIDDYYNLYNRKIIISPKMLSLDWLKEEKLGEVRSMLKF